jgi:hypothetical protein
MIKSIVSGSPVRKFVVYSGSRSRAFEEVNTEYWLFEKIHKKEYPKIVKQTFPDSPAEEQASIVEKLKYYQINRLYLNLKPSAALNAAFIEFQRQKEQTLKQSEPDEPVSRLGFNFDNTHDRAYVVETDRRREMTQGNR